jgi:hypothetical protein
LISPLDATPLVAVEVVELGASGAMADDED